MGAEAALNAALFVLCLRLAFGIIDQAVTTDHQSQERRFVEKRQCILLAVVNDLLPGTDEGEMRRLILEVSSSEPFDKESERALVADQVMFIFQDGVFLRAE
jgi:hypothetical protein